jgi:general secretion pathway protein E
MEQRYVGEILVRRGIVAPERLEELLALAADKGAALTDYLVAARVVEEEPLVRALADEIGIATIKEIKADEVSADLVDRVPITFARQHKVLALRELDGVVIVAVSDPLDPFPLDDLRALLGRPIEPVAAPREVIEDAINRVYERKDSQSLTEAREGEEVEELQDLIDMTDEAPVIRWVNNLFYQSVRERASDIHIEPGDKDVVVRFRIDGDLYEKRRAHKGFMNNIASRIKIEAGLNIAEKRLPQDGRITKKIAGKLIDVRVSTIPTAKGERIVMRLLDKEQVLLDLPDLGFDPAQLTRIEYMIGRPNGIVLVVGPTGSGKTTTLYACLNKINRPDLNILTVEDPVEYELVGIGQMQIQPKIGLTFASGLRAFLRQDPDVIMVGEIRDQETAEMSIQASLTGHLVLSTMHTTNAAGAVTRWVEMGVQNFLISSTLLAVLSQRLVRKLCQRCRQPYFPSEEDMRSLGLDSGSLPPAPPRDLDDVPTQITMVPRTTAPMGGLPALAPISTYAAGSRPVFYRSVGCEACAGTGYRGRVGIFELLVVDDAIRKEILNNSDSNTIHRVATSRGMRALRDDGARQVLSGATSLEEVLAATQEETKELEA